MKRKSLGFISEKRGKFKQLFPKIADRDLRFQEGHERQMIESLGSKLGKTTQELLNIIIGL